MVEFAEKLEDNKVSEWRNDYVDYEKLSRLLRKVEITAGARDKFATLHPEIDARVAAEYEAAQVGVKLTTVQEESEDGGESTEIEPLVTASEDEKYGGTEEGDVAETGAAGERKKLIGLTRDVDKHVEVFRSFLCQECERVHELFVERVTRLQHQLDVFIQSAQSTYGHEPARRLSHIERGKSIRTVISEKHNVAKPKVLSKLIGDESDEEEGDDANLNHVIREVASLKRALIDFHRTSMLLNNFAMMNYTAITRIAKKYNRLSLQPRIDLHEILLDPNYYEGKTSERLGDRIVSLYAEWFCEGDVTAAQAKMIQKKGDGLEMDWSQLRLGYRLGVCVTLMVWVCWDCVYFFRTEGEASIGGRTAFPVFRACAGLLLVHWFWGCSTYVWNRYRINYIYLFDFNPVSVDEPIRIFNDCVDETLMYLILMLLYYKTGTHQMPEWFRPGIYPLLLLLFATWKLVFPTRTRGPMWTAIWKVVTAPLSSPIFFHTYVADVFTSMIKVFLDVLWTCCFIFSGDFLAPGSTDGDQNVHLWQDTTWYKRVAVPLLCLFPLWIRLMQCLRRYVDTGNRMPNLANAAKYAMAQTVTLFGAFHPLYLLHGHEESHAVATLFQIFWLALFVSSSLYSFVWDVYMDWGLGRPKNAFLGPRLMFPSKYHYYGVIGADLVLRFMWVQSLIPPSSGAYFAIPAYLTAVNMSLELLRRTLWGFFRLENEQRTNTQGYRDEDFVPLHFTTQHEHKYKKHKARVGRQVLLEVLAVSAIVIIVSMLSVIVAQRSNPQVDLTRDL